MDKIDAIKKRNLEGFKTLEEEKRKAYELCKEFNEASPYDKEKKNQIFKQLVTNSGKDLVIEGPIRIERGTQLTVGNNTFINYNFACIDYAPVKIGANVYIGPNCSIYTQGHALLAEERKKHLGYAKPVTIGENSWLGGNVIVLPGVTIGDKCVVGAGSVVTKDIPSGYLAAGNPCKPIRKISKKDSLLN